MEPLLDLGEPVWQVLAIVFFVIPGLNAVWVIERLEGRLTLSPSERLIRGVSWSVFIYVLASPWLLDRVKRVSEEGIALRDVLGAAALLFLAPLAIGLGLFWLRSRKAARNLMRRLTTIHPAPTAWDYAFGPGKRHFARIRLRDGRMVAGYFGGGSFASAFPQRQDLFLEEAWTIDAEGSIVAPIEGSRGIFIRQESLEWLELLSVEVERVEA